MNYADFVNSKLAHQAPTGIAGAVIRDEPLFPHQRALTQWALRRGRCAIFAAMGLGKSRMAITWARHVSEHTGKPVLILTPLAVGRQMAHEGACIDVPVTVVRESADVRPGVNVCNYERLAKLDPSVFGGVVTDESSCIKGMGSKTLAQLIAAFGKTPFRLATTATPAPNSFDELGQHCELLGICSRAEMLAEYFIHDGAETQKWRLKGYARRDFWRFVASWGAMVRSPADLGFDGSAYVLPPIQKHVHVLEADEAAVRASGRLFAEHARTLTERRDARRASLDGRVSACAQVVNADDQPWLVFCDYNAESSALTESINGAVEVSGAMDTDAKEAALQRFLDGGARVLVSKASICGHGLNLQRAARVAFAGVSDSYEQQYQAIGRAHRFGQTREVHVHYFLSEMERTVLENIERKNTEAAQMADELASETRDAVREQVLGQQIRTDEYAPTKEMELATWM